jgi:hypothetical protein
MSLTIISPNNCKGVEKINKLKPRKPISVWYLFDDHKHDNPNENFKFMHNKLVLIQPSPCASSFQL